MIPNRAARTLVREMRMTDPTPLEPPRRWLYINTAGAILLAMVCFGASGGVDLLDLPGELMMAGALATRMHWPRISLALATVGGMWIAALIHEPTLTGLVAPLIVYSMARWADLPTRRITLGVMVLAVVVAPLSWRVDLLFGAPVFSPQTATILVVCTLTVGTAYAIGRTARTTLVSRAERLAAQQERERHLMVEREQQLRMNTVHERNRIARELHDIIAHSLSVIVVQAEGGRAVAARNPAMAEQALTTIADTSRSSLAEMRSMVRLLRGESDDSGEYVPAPGLADIPGLIERTGNATLTVDGDLPTVSDAVGLTAYRVVQESLTNVLKHAGPNVRAAVTITYWPGEIQLEVADNGRGAAAASDGQGNGVQGMQERLELHGGQLLARPQVGGGFLVRARLPYSPDATPASGPPQVQGRMDG